MKKKTHVSRNFDQKMALAKKFNQKRAMVVFVNYARRI